MNKRISLWAMLFTALAFSISAFAQVPQSIKYQAVARGSGGTVLMSTAVSVRLSILDGSPSGTLLFQEVHNPTTNQFGLFTLEVGSVNTSAFSNINWASGPKYMRVEIDPNGGSTFTVMGTDQLLSVPYALYAESAGNSGGTDNDTDSTNELQDLSSVVSNGTVTLNISGGTGTSFPVGDGDADPTNELQNLSLTGNTLSISNGNSVTLPTVGVADADGDSTNELNTNIALVGNTLQLTDAGGTLSVDLSTLSGDADADPANELNTSLTFDSTANTLTVTDAGGAKTVDLNNLVRDGFNTSFSFNVSTKVLTLTDGGNSFSVGLGSLVDADADSTNEIQTLSLAGQVLSLSKGGGSVNLPSGAGGTLDQAYDFGGAGAGRNITADAGAVEITTASSNAAGLKVTHSSTGAAIQAASTSSANTYPTIQATTTSTSTLVGAFTGSTTGAGYAVAGQAEAASTAFAALFGNNLRTNGGVGVNGSGFNGTSGDAYNVQGFGVFGENHSAASGARPSNLAAGVNGIGFVGTLGQTQVNDGGGVLGINLGSVRNGTYDNPGVEGQGFVGVLGQTNTTSIGYGLLSGGDIGGTGDLGVLGNLTAGGVKSFRIDNPMDPANKFLTHFSIESNEVLNTYRGTIQLDANGEAWVQLPEYFEKVNKNYSYYLTPIGASSPGLFVKKEIENNSFVIAGGQAGQKISWQVMAERNDPYLANHPEIRNDQPLKPSHQVGKYVHPSEYGKGAEDAIIHIHNKLQPSLLKVNEGTDKQQKLNIKSELR